MVAPLLALILAVLALLVTVMVDAAVANTEARDSHVFRLQFPRGLDPLQVTVFLTGLAGTRRLAGRLLSGPPLVAFEVHAEHGRLEHHLRVPRDVADAVLAHLRAAIPSVRVEEVDDEQPLVLQAGIELTTNTVERPLRVDRPIPSATALLATMQPLAEGERLVLQWVVKPAPLRKPARKQERLDDAPDAILPASYDVSPHVEALQAEKAKRAEVELHAVARLGVVARDHQRRQQLLNKLYTGLQLTAAVGIQLKRQVFVTSDGTCGRMARRARPPVRWPLLMNAGELAALIGWPVGVDVVPGLQLGGARQLPPDRDIPSEGLVIGKSTAFGSERLIALDDDARRKHIVVLGPTGVGKSTELLSFATQLMQSGSGLLVVEPRGDLIEAILDRVPDDRVEDVVLLDPSDTTRPVGLNLLDDVGSNPELIADGVVHSFAEIFERWWGPRSDDILRSSLLTLIRTGGMTLAELPLLLTSASWRAPLVARVQDDVALASFWSGYLALRPNEMATTVSPILNKARAVLLRSKLVHTLGQAKPRLNFGEALNSQKIILAPLRQGDLGDDGAALLGALITARAWSTIQTRSALLESERKPVTLILDEAHLFTRLPTSLGDALAQGRALNFSVIAATQHSDQWPPDLQRDVLANARSRVLFQLTANDARLFERELSPFITADDLKGLGKYEVIAQVVADERVVPPVTAVTLPPPPVTGNGARARAYSREHYGRDIAELKEEMRARQQVVPLQTPGRRTRKTTSDGGRSGGRSSDEGGGDRPGRRPKGGADA